MKNYSGSLLSLCSLFIFACSAVISLGQSEELSEADKVKLREQLEEIKKSAEKSSKGRFLTALKAFRNAIKSDTAAHDLYIKCIEKTNFTDQKKSSQDFRDWKRSHKEKGDSPEFRRALQHQLNWLLLSIEASVKPDEIESLGTKALDKIDAIMADHKKLKSHRQVLEQSVLSSVYAKYYNINGLEAKKWPLSPLKISEVYEQVVMPPLRLLTSASRLRGAWKRRIEHEGLMRKNWGAVPKSAKIGMKKDNVPPEFEKWKENGYLDLLWAKEKDCYKAGDEKQASANMLAHLSKYIKHKQSLKWSKDFENLISEDPTEDEEIKKEK